ncbi:MAG: NAD(P)H-dependent oxidoreductase, partial [Bdellovibrionales bacterium]|nr:NAD(P)H-dependent oxidoreductase [Bdellovibrionales bacterium]
MIQVISGSDRKDSRSRQVAEIVRGHLVKAGAETEIIDLHTVPLESAVKGAYNDEPLPKSLAEVVEKVNSSDGLVMITPEYNGSMPGVLKYFIDQWSYPKSFEHRPVAFVGLGGRF